MKKFTEKGIVQKIIISLVTIILLQFCMQNRVIAADAPEFDWGHPLDSIGEQIVYALSEIGESMLIGSARLVASIGDLAMSALNNWMLGTSGYGTAMISQEALSNTKQWFHSNVTPSESAGSEINIAEEGDNTIVYVPEDYIEEEPAFLGSDSWEIPNLLYCPENIFGNNIAMLDVNFLNPNDYTSVVEDGKGYNTAKEKAENSIASSLKSTISNWYKAFRNIAVVALLSILVYLGIRILISSTAEDKAKYKETIKDWLVALCLVFFMHFIMSATIMIVNQINTLFAKGNDEVYVTVGGNGTTFKSNFMGVLRFLAQSKETADAWAYTIMYVVLVFYTISFTLQYLKRVLYIAFYTMISPMVAITYPIDKLGDGKSQAFNMWFKEYMMTMILQPIHLIIYKMLVTSALDLSIQSPLYAIVAIGFMIPAEQFIKKLFGVQSTADGGFGSFASGALAMNALKDMKSKVNKSSKNGGNFGGNSKDSNEISEENTNIRQTSNSEFASFKGNDSENQLNGVQENNNLLNGNNNANNPYGLLDNGANEGYNADFGNINTGWGNDSMPGAYDVSMSDVATPYMLSKLDKDEENQTQNQLDDAQEQEQLRRLLQQNEDRNNNLRANNAPDMSEDDKEARKKAIKGVYRSGKFKVWKARGKKMGAGLLKAGLATAKFGLKAAGATAGGTLGIAAGIATGKGLSGAVQGASVGIAAGSALGAGAYNLGKRGVRGVARGVKGAVKADLSDRREIKQLNDNREMDILKATEGEEAAAQYAREHFKPNAKQKAKYKEIADAYSLKTGQKTNWKDLQDKIYDYESHGVTDSKQITKGLELENKYYDRQNIHDNMVDVMQTAKNYSDDYIYDTKKQAVLDNKLENNGVTGESKENFKELFYAAHGADYAEEKQKQERVKAEKEAQAQAEKVRQQEERRQQIETDERNRANAKRQADLERRQAEWDKKDAEYRAKYGVSYSTEEKRPE